jgi:hypothetical protein
VEAGQLSGMLEPLGPMSRAAVEPEGPRVGLDPLDHLVVEPQEGEVKLRDDEVLIVAEVTDEGPGPLVGIVAPIPSL